MAIRQTALLLCAVLTSLLVGCRHGSHIEDADYPQVAAAVEQSWHAADPAAEALPPPPGHLAGPHPVEDYIAHALAQNPEIHAARKRLEALALRVPVAASLQDPMLSLTVQPEPVQTAAGEQEFTLGASQKVPWFGKLNARAAAAEAQANVARAEFAAVELATIAAVKQAYYELYFIQQAIKVTESEKQLLIEIRKVANSRYKTGQTSQQDVLRTELEISNVVNELVRLRQRLASAQARLASLLHIAPETDLQALDRLPAQQAPQDLAWLQRQAVAARPELHARLAALEHDQRQVELAHLDYRPDVTLGFSWIDVSSDGISPVANGDDALLLTAGLNLPVYRKRLGATVRSTQAQAVAAARQYDAVRDRTLAEVADLFAQARSQQELIKLFREDILPKAKQTLQVSSKAYNVGEVDFLQLIDNWRQLLRYEVSYLRLQASLRQTLAELERVVGGYGGPAAEPLPER